ncbi:single-stranded-DNA-specific exonuclease RecJ [Bacillaceae bacterium]
MLHARTRWQVAEVDEAKCEALAKAAGIPLLLAKLLVIRGIETKEAAEAFFGADERFFHDPFLLDGMEKAVHRINKALVNGEKILIYGDYDADGVSSTSLLIHTFKRLNATFGYYIPNRFTEGYGLHQEALAKAREQGYSLVITVDTGISALPEAEWAKGNGFDLIITDHHEPPETLPDAHAVINPKKPGCPYPFKMLAGVGVAFKLAHALLGQPPLHLLDIAAIGTISDLVPLVDENRVLAKLGLQALNRARRPGIRALLQVSGLTGKEIGAGHVGFALGPRINASGRLDSATDAVTLLTTEDEEEARALAQRLDGLNRERQELVQQIAREAEAIVEGECKEDRVLVVAKEGWNIGVIGIVASRLVEKYYRPTIVLSIDGEKGVAKGSARSIAGFDIYRALTACKEILPHFGGHTMAAGMTLHVDDLGELRARLNRLADKWLKEEDFIPLTCVDAELRLSDIDVTLIEQLERLAPFGIGNHSPLFLLKEVEIKQARAIGKDGEHFKCGFVSSREDGATLEAVGFGLGALCERISLKARANVVGELAINEWNGYRKPQFLIKDLSVPHVQVFDWRGTKERLAKVRSLAADGATAVVYFREESAREMEALRFLPAQIFLLRAAEVRAGVPAKQLVLYDLPTSIALLRQVMGCFSAVERVYCVFGEKDARDPLSTLPKRETFKWLYAHLYKRKKIHEAQLVGLARKQGLPLEVIQFMLGVFCELDFIARETDGYVIKENPRKRDLSESQIYRKKREEIDVETELLYAPYQTLCGLLSPPLPVETGSGKAAARPLYAHPL